jgi:hypothetical protein
MADAAMPSWAKRGAGNSADAAAYPKRRTTDQDHLIPALTQALASAHMIVERDLRETSACVKTTALIFSENQHEEKWPGWVEEALDELRVWFQKLDDETDTDRQKPGSPHVQIGVRTISAVLNHPDIKKVEHKAMRDRLMQWWNQTVVVQGKTENDVAEEIQVFRVSGPPPNKQASGDAMELEGQTRPFVKMIYRLGSPEVMRDFTQALQILQADIRRGPGPKSKPTKEVAKLLKQLQSKKR